MWGLHLISFYSRLKLVLIYLILASIVLEPAPWCFAYDKVNYALFLTYYYEIQCFSSRGDPRPISNHHWWDEPGPETKVKDKTFSQLAESALVQVFQEGAKNHRIDVVFDKETSFTRGHPLKMQKEPTEVQIQEYTSGTFSLGTTSSNGESSCAVLPTRQASSSSW